MELKLIVLAGAKEGTQIPLKKDKFIIGRASECTLRAGSNAISRHHCEFARTDDTWRVRDLGSRNGTYLNDQKVESPTALAVGDEVRVGPLKFRVEARKPSSDIKLAKPAEPARSEDIKSQDINRTKEPPAKDVAEVARRTVAKNGNATSEEDITRWLLDEVGNDSMLKETQTLSMEETTTINRSASLKSPPTRPAPSAEVLSEEKPADSADVAADPVKDENAAASESSGWNFLKFGKTREKKKVGKLPPRAPEQSKDSRSAAADILREMTRRR